MLAVFHAALPYAGIALFAVIGVLALLGAAGRRAALRLGVAAEAVNLIAMLAVAIAGLGLLLAGPGPRDILHLLYGAAIVAVVPGADLASLGRPPRTRALWRAGAALAGIALIARSFATG